MPTSLHQHKVMQWIHITVAIESLLATLMEVIIDKSMVIEKSEDEVS